jgi:hypothetical protein
MQPYGDVQVPVSATCPPTGGVVHDAPTCWLPDGAEHHGEHVAILRYKTPAAVLVSVTRIRTGRSAG